MQLSIPLPGHLIQKHQSATRGEDYAERFALNRFEELFPAYVRVFGDPKIGE